MEDSRRCCKVCVTGSTGYIGSSLIKKLLDRGNYIVHATLRNLGDTAKVGLLKTIAGAESRLKLFEADIYDAEQFEAAIKDCQYVLHIATPLQHTDNSKYKDTSEAAVAGVKSIAMSCIRSGTVKRLVFTASVLSASPLKHDGSGYMDIMDENCWTPLNIPLLLELQDYTISKTQSERELLSFNKLGNLEVVSLALGLVGGETLLPYISSSMSAVVSQLTDHKESGTSEYEVLRFLEELCGKVPMLHIEDACEALVFCIEKDRLSGRFLRASNYVSSAEIAEYYKLTYPELLKQECRDVPKRTVRWGSTKLMDKGFKYEYDLEDNTG